jgi:tRNA 2-thiouridine synthesizing protein A
MAPGARLLVAATDPVARIDMPHFCAEAGHRLLLAESRDGVHRFLIGRGGSPPTATR